MKSYIITVIVLDSWHVMQSSICFKRSFCLECVFGACRYLWVDVTDARVVIDKYSSMSEVLHGEFAFELGDETWCPAIHLINQDILSGSSCWTNLVVLFGLRFWSAVHFANDISFASRCTHMH